MSGNYVIDKYFIGKDNPAWTICDSVCWDAKNLYNQANYIVRNQYFSSGTYLNYYAIRNILMKDKESCFYKMKAKVAQSVLMELDKNWIGYFAAKKSFFKDKSKFNGKPKVPGYKDKTSGRKNVNYNIQAISKKFLNKGLLKLSGLDFTIKLRLIESIDSDGVVNYHPRPNLKEVSILPHNDGYLIVAKYLDLEKSSLVTEGHSAGVDLGINNLAAIATTNKDASSYLINGKPLKSMNAYYNKKLARFRSELDTNKTKRGKKRIKSKIQKLCRKRQFKVNHYLHVVSKMLVNQLVSNGVTNLVIGKNDGWKQETNIGKVNNQNFVNIPHTRFIEMIKYKWEKTGRIFKTTNESYTSKCSFLDLEEICKHDTYKGQRVKRGLFVSSQSHKINSDINGAGNILRKVIKNAWSSRTQEDLIQGFVVSPVRLTANEFHTKLKP